MKFKLCKLFTKVCLLFLCLKVTAAYKKALFRFHPDRAAALAKSDPAHQVEAEEKFKLVSRMKGVLPLVSSSYFR